MNTLTIEEFERRFAHRVRVRARVLDPRRRVAVFSDRGEADSLGRIYVINLDRMPDRWGRVQRELDRFRGRHGERLAVLARRISAVDARFMKAEPDPSVLRPTYTLADQLAVEPNPLLKIDDASRSHEIFMTAQEIAVALSHIEAWRRVAAGEDRAALILEDDVVMPSGFARRLGANWTALESFDLLYLAFKDVSGDKPRPSNGPVRRQKPGVWEAAAYVLTKTGAQRLLDRLPAFGPIDLWLNLQFHAIEAFTAGRQLIEQRVDEPSTNSYSVLPVLSQVGVITKEKALLPSSRKLRGPVIGLGRGRPGTTSLAKALSMIGYTCLSDLDLMPANELGKLRNGNRDRLFNAYINIGSLDDDALVREIAAVNPRALIIVTSSSLPSLGLPVDRVLHLTPAVVDKWKSLSDFLKIEYPPFSYPEMEDVGQRVAVCRCSVGTELPAVDLKFDASPWIVPRGKDMWQGVSTEHDQPSRTVPFPVKWSAGEPLDDGETWKLRNDTFPSNLALFSPHNVTVSTDGFALSVRREITPVREFTGAAVASRASHVYGSFAAEMRPARGSGLVTGLFLHRNGPRQEIDIEFLGRDTTKLLVNVYYNPGPDGTKLEYGYRGTPTMISLGFDAAAAFHTYEIDWRPDRIAWKVDGTTVYERNEWNPTPIPDRPLEFNLNLWHPRSTEFAGRLDTTALPASTEVRSIVLTPSGP